MWMLVLTAFAGDFGREDEPLSETRYARVLGNGPVTGKWRNRRGAFAATHFEDGQIEHYDRYDGDVLAETRTFAADGSPVASVDRVAQSVTLHLAPERVVSFVDWKEWTIGGLTFHAPALVETDGRWAGGGLAVQIQPAADPFSADFTTALRAGCGCEIEARMTTWIAGRPGAHFRLQRRAETADLVAVPVDGGLLVLSAAGADLDALVPLRAMMATAREAR